MMPKIVVTQPIHEEVLARLMQVGEVVMNPGPEPWSEGRAPPSSEGCRRNDGFHA